MSSCAGTKPARLPLQFIVVSKRGTNEATRAWLLAASRAQAARTTAINCTYGNSTTTRAG